MFARRSHVRPKALAPLSVERISPLSYNAIAKPLLAGFGWICGLACATLASVRRVCAPIYQAVRTRSCRGDEGMAAVVNLLVADTAEAAEYYESLLAVTPDSNAANSAILAGDHLRVSLRKGSGASPADTTLKVTSGHARPHPGCRHEKPVHHCRRFAGAGETDRSLRAALDSAVPAVLTLPEAIAGWHREFLSAGWSRRILSLP